MTLNFLNDDYTINFYDTVRQEYDQIGPGQDNSIPMQLGLFYGTPNLRGQSSENAYYVEKSNTTLKN